MTSVDKKALLEKIEQMPIEDLHALLCHVLDESGIDYEIAPGTIPFYGLLAETFILGGRKDLNGDDS